jgi:hypothetical protein
MNGFLGVTDNNWFAYVTLLKQDWPKARGSRRKAIINEFFNNNMKTAFNKPMTVRGDVVSE